MRESIPLSPWRVFKEKWKDCKECFLHEYRTKIVLARGIELPCDILFIGEAPGFSEDTIGLPFVGPAGILLDQIINRALEDISPKPRMAFTNLVCCIPIGEDGDKVKEPEVECIRACAPRLKDFIKVAAPNLLVLVGALAEDWIGSKMRHGIETGIPSISIIHPAAILRQGVSIVQKEALLRKSVIKIRSAASKINEV